MSLLPSPANPMLLFGCGNMGGAMLQGWLAGGIDPAAFVVVDPYAANLPAGITHHADAAALGQQFSIALLAIKPQMVDELAPHVEMLLAPNALLISILAGTRTSSLQAKFPGRSIVRLMPNLAAAIGKSPMGLFSTEPGIAENLAPLLAPLGSAYWLDNENQIDAVTALAGSGPAFAYRFIDALAKAGTKLGLEPEQALGLAKTMLAGSAELAATSNADPAELARRVTSPGGTTAAGLAVLDEGNALEQMIEATLTAARDRGIELSKAK